MERLDLVQFHRWDFSTARLAEVLDAGIPVVSQRIQYSLVDDGARRGMVDHCRSRDVALLCYGTVCGGFLSERWLGLTDPGLHLTNRALSRRWHRGSCSTASRWRRSSWGR